MKPTPTQTMKRRHARILRAMRLPVVLLGLGLTHPAAATWPEWKAPGENIALGKTYTFSKPPHYYLTTDPDDAIQLTDGKHAPDHNAMWHFKPTVGWFGTPVAITIDLGEVRSIAGLSYSTESHAAPGVGWPPAILVLVSDDGDTFRLAGELVRLTTAFGPPPVSGRHLFKTDQLHTRARFVQLVIQCNLFVFSDEIEVYAGPDDNLTRQPTGPVIEDGIAYLKQQITAYAVAARVAQDAARVVDLLQTIKTPPLIAGRLNKQLADVIRETSAAMPIPDDPDFRATLPLNALHSRTFQSLGAGLRAVGYPALSVWHRNRWARQTPFDLPPAKMATPTALTVRMVQQERRGEILNIANFGDQPLTAVVSFSGLPGGSQPDYVDIRQVEYVPLHSQPWDASPLPLAERVSGGWRVSLPAGLSRQIWLDFRLDRKDLRPGRYHGGVEIQIEGGSRQHMRAPLVLTVDSWAMPPHQDRAVAVGVWDYTSKGGGRGYGIGGGNDNLAAGIAHLQESGVTAPWHMTDWQPGDIFPWVSKEMFDEAGVLTGKPDFRAFDEWVRQWPDAKYYMIYAAVGFNFGGAGTWGTITPEATSRIKQVMQAWEKHIIDNGGDPSKVALLLVDEPGDKEKILLTTGWAKAIKESGVSFRLYTDPMMSVDLVESQAGQDMLALMDIITPGRGYQWMLSNPVTLKRYADAYGRFREMGKIMGYYACAQNISEGEAIRYYRSQQWDCWMLSGGADESWTGFWAYADLRGNKPWNQLIGGSDRNWSPVYIDSTSVTDSKHWLAIFEGVQDYEYLLMLKTRVEALEQAGRGREPPVAAARKLLDTVVDETLKAVAADDLDACDAGRLRVLAALDALAK